MSFGTVSELILLGHYEDLWQLVPIVLIGVSIIIFILLHWRLSLVFLKLFNGLMMGCVLGGILGTWFHVKANMEFEMELHPSLSGLSLMIDSLSGALPALAPGSMIVFGLIGYLYTILIKKQPK